MNNTIIALVVLLIIVSGAYMYLYLHTQNISETHINTTTFVRDWDVITMYVSYKDFDLKTLRFEENTTYIRLYLADDINKMTEGYRYKSSYDFANKNASGMIFLLYKYYKDHVCITMRNVSLSLTVFIANLNIGIGEKQTWKPNENRYYIEYARIDIMYRYDLKPGDEICISLEHVHNPIMIEIDPALTNEIIRITYFHPFHEIGIVREDAEKIAFK